MAVSRRSAPLLSVLFAGFATYLIASLVSTGQTFLTASPSGNVRGGRTAMRGFKEDFEAWRSSLTPEERQLMADQAEGEFNKGFRKSDAFKQELSKEKIGSFAQVLGKFFDTESEDYKKEQAAKTPDYNSLLKKAGDKKLDMSLKNRIVELDRDADRRYHFATQKIRQAESKGEYFMQSSPYMEKWTVPNGEAAEHEANKKLLETLKQVAADSGCPAKLKPAIEEAVKKGVPAMGQEFSLTLPQVLVNQGNWLRMSIAQGVKNMAKTKSESEVSSFVSSEVPKVGSEMVGSIVEGYYSARNEVQKAADDMKAFYRGQEKFNDPKRTKADVLKQMWAELGKGDKKLPPLDEEVLAELAKEPAVQEGEYMHSWGTADKLYKSEAIDAFGLKYLLGVFETTEEATKAFEEWNKEYEAARVTMKSEMDQWAKQEAAR
eukprot:CAMPEP_0170597010 /NCGR_PEP_ID=MMETSP0224-20130122/15464_1 /TAXON_ID=285029 /ORGANISM="Togula jolla, Strain CCCM 725" /LENGTH=432 /DNA_ID=CAMNT_0010921423 /DNA_START=74 /DNA_END=1368 /DNA_ORIENTATION=+